MQSTHTSLGCCKVWYVLLHNFQAFYYELNNIMSWDGQSQTVHRRSRELAPHDMPHPDICRARTSWPWFPPLVIRLQGHLNHKGGNRQGKRGSRWIRANLVDHSCPDQKAREAAAARILDDPPPAPSLHADSRPRRTKASTAAPPGNIYRLARVFLLWQRSCLHFSLPGCDCTANKELCVLLPAVAVSNPWILLAPRQ